MTVQYQRAKILKIYYVSQWVRCRGLKREYRERCLHSQSLNLVIKEETAIQNRAVQEQQAPERGTQNSKMQPPEDELHGSCYPRGTPSRTGS